MKCYRVKSWDAVFEDRRTREVKKMEYCFLPIAEDGEGFRTLMQTNEGITAYGVFIALVRIAGRCPERGVFADERGPLTTDRMAIRTGMPKQVVADAVKLLESPEVGWLETFECENGYVGAAPTRRRHSADEPPHLQQCNGQCSLPEQQGNGQAVRLDTPGARGEIPLPAAALPNSQAAQGTAHCRNALPGNEKTETPPRNPEAKPNENVQAIAAELMRFEVGKAPLYDEGSAKAIARELCRNRKIIPGLQLVWAIETMHDRARTESIDNYAGYFRKLLLKERAPPEWIHEYQRKKAQELK